jgi:hypothetical protein
MRRHHVLQFCGDYQHTAHLYAMLKVSPNIYYLLGNGHLPTILKHRNLIDHQLLHECKLRYFDELVQKEIDSTRPRRPEARY